MVKGTSKDSKGENWEKAADSTWDYATSPDKWKETANSAAEWVKNNPRKVGNIEGEILETAAEIYFTAGAATAAKKVAVEGVEKGAKELGEKAVKEAAEEGAEHTLPGVITKEGVEAAAEVEIKSVEDLLSAGTKLPRVKAWAQRAIKGNIDDIFNSLAERGELGTTLDGKSRIKLPDGTTITKYSAQSESPSLQVNQGGKITKVRIDE